MVGVNIGNDDERTILEFAKFIKKLAGSNSKITFLPLSVDDPMQRKPDISKAKRMLGWEPKVPLEEGLLKIIEYFRIIL